MGLALSAAAPTAPVNPQAFIPMRRHVPPLTLLFLAAGVLAAGCAHKFDIGGADTALRPQQVAGNPALAGDTVVAWGGAIVATRNLQNTSELEVLGYPLDDNNRPVANNRQTGRFIVLHPGYLESADYAAGRQVTVVGTLAGTRTGRVGEANYVYPVVKANRLHLWPKETAESSEPRIHFGIGVGISR